MCVCVRERRYVCVYFSCCFSFSLCLSVALLAHLTLSERRHVIAIMSFMSIRRPTCIAVRLHLLTVVIDFSAAAATVSLCLAPILLFRLLLLPLLLFTLLLLLLLLLLDPLTPLPLLLLPLFLPPSVSIFIHYHFSPPPSSSVLLFSILLLLLLIIMSSFFTFASSQVFLLYIYLLIRHLCTLTFPYSAFPIFAFS